MSHRFLIKFHSNPVKIFETHEEEVGKVSEKKFKRPRLKSSIHPGDGSGRKALYLEMLYTCAAAVYARHSALALGIYLYEMRVYKSMNGAAALCRQNEWNEKRLAGARQEKLRI